MKLLLPNRLRKALIATFAVAVTLFSYQANGASSLTSTTTVNADDGVTYSGYIFNISSGGQFHSRTFTQYYDDGTGNMVNGTTYAGNSNNLNVELYNDGEVEKTYTTNGTNQLWMNFGNGSSLSSEYGNTLRFAESAAYNLETTFAVVSFGGIIVEDNVTSVYVGGSGRAMELVAANGATVNMNIGANTTLVFNSLDILSSGNWTIDSGATLLFNQNQAVNLAADKIVTVSGGGALSIAGSLTMASGSNLTIEDGSRFEIGNTITNNGTLTVDGTIGVSSLDNLYKEDTLTYGDILSGDTANGFASGDIDYFLVRGSGTNTFAQDTINYDGVDYNLTNDGNGNVYFTAEAEAGVYYINTAGTFEYDVAGSANSMASDVAKAIYVQVAGSTIELKSNLNSNLTGGIVLNAATTLDIASNVTLNADSITKNAGSSLTLTGSGSFEANISQLGSVTIDSTWTGNNILSGAVSGFNLNSYGNANSTITFNGITSGHLAQGTTFTSNIVLTNRADGTTALYLTDGNSSPTSTFTGSLSGTGDFVRTSNGGSDSYRFTGDISQFSGGINHQRNNVVCGILFGNGSDYVGTSGDSIGAIGTGGANNILNVQGRTTVNYSNDVELKMQINNTGNTASIFDKSGAGTLIISNSGNTYAGTLNISGGSVKLIGDATWGTGAINTQTSGIFEIAKTADSTFSNTISGSGSVVHSGSATTTLGGNNSYTGDTNVTAGTLVTAHNKALGNSAVTVSNGAKLSVGAAGLSTTSLTMNAGSTLSLAESVSLTTSFTIGGAFTIDLTDYTAINLGTELNYTLVESASLEGDINDIILAGLNYDTIFYTHQLVDVGGNLTLQFTANPVESLTVTAVPAYNADSKVLTLQTSLTDGAALSGIVALTFGQDILDLIKAEMGSLFQTIEIALQDENGNALSLEDVTALSIHGDMGLDGWTVKQIDGVWVAGPYYGAFIPEPSTVTLSLLALAGLAARRRRKA